MEHRSSVQVVVRVRPPNAKELDEPHAVSVVQSGSAVQLEGESRRLTCEYDHVLDELQQQDAVFAALEPMFSDVLRGYNACIFAYGQTGSGKTHTMLGPDGGRDATSRNQSCGVIPRAVTFLFDALSSNPRLQYEVHCSYVQIYNERLHDLLQDRDRAEPLKIREYVPLGRRQGRSSRRDHGLNSGGERGGREAEVYVAGLSQFRVSCAEDVLDLIQVGGKNRALRATAFNEASSRSHAILQLSFEIQDSGAGGDVTLRKAKLSMVDLAGSEKMDTSVDITAAHRDELSSINKSLSALGNVVARLAKRDKMRTNGAGHSSEQHIPYRDSKLTRLLQDSLGGNTKTCIVACVSPSRLQENETASTLQFADRARQVMVRTRANQVVDDKALLARAQTEIARLKLLLKHALGGADISALKLQADSNEEMTRLLMESERLREENRRLRNMLLRSKDDSALGELSVHNGHTQARVRAKPGLARLRRAKAQKRKQLRAQYRRGQASTAAGNSRTSTADTVAERQRTVSASRVHEIRSLVKRYGYTEEQARQMVSVMLGPEERSSRRASSSRSATRHSGTEDEDEDEDEANSVLSNDDDKYDVDLHADEDGPSALGLIDENELVAQAAEQLRDLEPELELDKLRADLVGVDKLQDAHHIMTNAESEAAEQLKQEEEELAALARMREGLEAEIAALASQNGPQTSNYHHPLSQANGTGAQEAGADGDRSEQETRKQDKKAPREQRSVALIDSFPAANLREKPLLSPVAGAGPETDGVSDAVAQHPQQKPASGRVESGSMLLPSSPPTASQVRVDQQADAPELLEAVVRRGRSAKGPSTKKRGRKGKKKQRDKGKQSQMVAKLEAALLRNPLLAGAGVSPSAALSTTTNSRLLKLSPYSATGKPLPPFEPIDATIPVAGGVRGAEAEGEHGAAAAATGQPLGSGPEPAPSMPAQDVTQLTFSAKDVGLRVQVYSFRYDAWEPMEIVAYDTFRQLHCGLCEGDQRKWIDLRSKSVRVNAGRARKPRTKGRRSRHGKAGRLHAGAAHRPVVAADATVPLLEAETSTEAYVAAQPREEPHFRADTEDNPSDEDDDDTYAHESDFESDGHDNDGEDEQAEEEQQLGGAVDEEDFVD